MRTTKNEIVETLQQKISHNIICRFYLYRILVYSSSFKIVHKMLLSLKDYDDIDNESIGLNRVYLLFMTPFGYHFHC